jgi:hypothetical protein
VLAERVLEVLLHGQLVLVAVDGQEEALPMVPVSTMTISGMVLLGWRGRLES